MRCFISAELPREVKAYLGGLRAELGRVSGVNFVPEENLHVTLAFLGELSANELEGISRNAEAVAGHFSSFACALGKIEAVPLKMPRIIWVSVKDGKRLEELHNALETALHLNGSERFSGHITLARIKTAGAARELSRKVHDMKILQMNFRVENISIMESRLTPQGAVYSAVRTFKLQQ